MPSVAVEAPSSATPLNYRSCYRLPFTVYRLPFTRYRLNREKNFHISLFASITAVPVPSNCGM
jgi:hypothetical protein